MLTAELEGVNVKSQVAECPVICFVNRGACSFQLEDLN
jgi:hypothetical protein